MNLHGSSKHSTNSLAYILIKLNTSEPYLYVNRIMFYNADL